jgi:hypothetical protein
MCSFVDLHGSCGCARKINTGLAVLIAGTMKSCTFRNIPPCRPVNGNRHFGGYAGWFSPDNMGVISQDRELFKHTLTYGNVPDQCCLVEKTGGLSAGQCCFKLDRARRSFKSTQAVTLSLLLQFPTFCCSCLATMFTRKLEVVTFASTSTSGPLMLVWERCRGIQQ